jgi:hypothetical protein
MKESMERWGAGRPEMQRAVIRRNTTIREAHDPDSRVICMAALIPQAVKTDPGGEREYIERIESLIDGVSAKLPSGSPVYVNDPMLRESCQAGPWARPLRDKLAAGLQSKGHDVFDRRRHDRAVVQVELSGGHAGRPLQVTAYVRATGAQDAVQAASVVVKPHWVGIRDEKREMACHTDSDMGLAFRQRTGRNGLEVYVDISGITGGQICEGVEYEMEVRVSEPARVQLYSLDTQGRAALIWPVRTRAENGGFVEAPNGVVRDSYSQGGFASFVLDAEAREHLVAVAVPENSRFEATSELKQECAIDEFGDQHFPSDAAVDVLDIFIERSGTGSCSAGKGLPPDQVESYRQLWAGIKDCPLAD